MKAVYLPTGQWRLALAQWHGNQFLIACSPEHPAQLVGTTASNELFVRPLTDAEFAMAHRSGLTA